MSTISTPVLLLVYVGTHSVEYNDMNTRTGVRSVLEFCNHRKHEKKHENGERLSLFDHGEIKNGGEQK